MRLGEGKCSDLRYNQGTWTFTLPVNSSYKIRCWCPRLHPSSRFVHFYFLYVTLLLTPKCHTVTCYAVLFRAPPGTESGWQNAEEAAGMRASLAWQLQDVHKPIIDCDVSQAIGSGQKSVSLPLLGTWAALQHLPPVPGAALSSLSPPVATCGECIGRP